MDNSNPWPHFKNYRMLELIGSETIYFKFLVLETKMMKVKRS